MDTMKHVHTASRLGRFTTVLLTLLILTIGQAWGDNAGFWSDNAAAIKYYAGSDVEYVHNATGVSTRNLSTVTDFYLKGWWFKMWRNSGGNVCADASLFYRVYRTNESAPAFSELSEHTTNWDVICHYKDGLNINLLSGLDGGTYYFEYYFKGFGNWNSSSGCDEQYLSNGGGNYKIQFEYKKTESSLVTITENYEFSPSVGMQSGGLYEGRRILSIGGSDYSSGLQIKNGRQIAFKVNAGARVIVTYRANDGRSMTMGTSYDKNGYSLASSTNGTLAHTFSEASTVYLAASKDLYLTHLQVSYSAPTTYTLTYAVPDKTAGSVPAAVGSLASGANVTLDAARGFSRTGYNFNKWNDGSTNYNASAAYVMPANDVTMTAIWTAKQTAVTFNKNGGSGGQDNNTISYGANSKPAGWTAPTWAGHTFEGYFDAATDGTKYFNADGSAAKAWDIEDAAKTLYAHWTGDSPTPGGCTDYFIHWNAASSASDVKCNKSNTGNVLFEMSLTSANRKDESFTYKGDTYSKGIKLESSTVVTYTPKADGIVVLYFLNSNQVKINDVTKSLTDDKYQLEVTKNTTYTIKRGGSENSLYIIEFTCSGPSYYIKHNWNAGGSWSWKQLADNGDGTYSLLERYGGTGCNWNFTAADAGATWVPTPTLIDSPVTGDSCIFTLNPTANSGNGSITITKVISTYYIYLGQTLTLPEGVVATYDASDEVNNVPAYYYDNFNETTEQYSRTGALTIAGRSVTGNTLGKFQISQTGSRTGDVTVYVYRYYAKYPWGACNLEPAEDYNKAWKWQAMANPAGDNLQVVGLYSHAVNHHANIAWDYAYDWDGLYKYDGSGTPDLHPGLDEHGNQGKWIDGTDITSGGSVYKEIPRPTPDLNCAAGDYIELDYAPGTLTGPEEPSLSTNFTTQNGASVAAGFKTLTYVAVPEGGGVITHNASADKVAQGTKVTFHAETNSGYQFIGWYSDAECTSKITGASVNAEKQSHLATVNANYAVYAKFMPHVTGVAVTAANDKTTLMKGETVQLSAVFTPAGSLPEDQVVTWSSANSTLVSVTSTGLVSANGATDGTVITARSANGVEGTIKIVVVENCDSWMISYWNTASGYEYSGRACFNKLYPDDDTDHEWRTDNTFVLKASSENDKIWVGNAGFTEHSRNWTTSQLTTVGLQSNNDATNYYPGQDATGYLRIFDNSTEENYYVAFEPTYQVLYGVNGGPAWTVMDFHNVSGHEYETDLLTAPSGYKSNDNFQYFVGTKRVNERSQFVDEKSRYDKLNDVNGLSSSDMAGKYGKFHIWGNSPDKNWFCEFIPYYVVELYDRDEQFGETQSSKASAAGKVVFSTPDARTGYTFGGWEREDGTLTITESMPEWINYAMRTSYERFNSVWTPINYTITLDNQSATTAGTTNVTATYDANTNLTSAITIPKKDDAAFDGYYTSPAGAGVQLIDAYGNFIANVADYTDALGNWIHADDVTLYAKWVNTCDEILGLSTDYTAGKNNDRKVYTFGNGAKIYSCDSGFKPNSTDRIKAGSAEVKECSGNESIYAFNQRYLVLQFPVDVADITLYAYSKGNIRNVESVKVANAAALLPASPSFSAIDIDVIPNTVSGCQVLNASFRQPVAANKFIAVDLGGSADIYRICYTPANAKATQPILPALTDLNANAGTNTGWDATITNAGSLQGGETVTYSWTNEDGDEIATTATLSLNNLNMSQSGKYTITVTVQADGLKDAVATKTLTLTVNCPDVKPEVYLVSSNTESKTFGVRRSDNQTAYSEGSFQWYKDDALIPGATSETYTAWQTGHYYVEYINYCSTKSDTYGDFTADPNAPVATRLAPFQYCHKGRTYIENRRLVHLFYVKSSGTGEYEGKYQITATKNSAAIALPTNAIVEDVSGEGKNILLDLNVMATQGAYAVNDVITITVVPYLNTNALSAVINASIDVKIIADATPTLAFIVSGTDVAAGTKNKKSHTVGGDFLTAANRADLCVQTGITSFDSERELPLYTALKSNFLVTPVNGYADFSLYNYEPFDLVFLTDFVKRDGGKDKATQEKAAAVLNDLAEVVDYRPIFSTKAYVSTLSKWKALGINANPNDPVQTQKWMNITCSSHTMFRDIDFEHDVPVETGSDEYVFTMLDAAGFDNGKALQGFDFSQVGRDFTMVATTHNDATARIEGMVVTPDNIGPKDKLLVVSMERQLVMDARLLMLVLNADAHSQLSTQGINVIVSALKYLLITNEDDIVDCSKVFKGTNNQYWDEASNWLNSDMPTSKDKVRVIADCVVRNTAAEAAEVNICTGGSHNGHLTIQANGAIQVTGEVKRVEDGHYFRPMPTQLGDIFVEASSAGSGALIQGDNVGRTKAVVQYYSKASGEDNGTGGLRNAVWQWMATPFIDEDDVQDNYYGAWMMSYDNSTHSWSRRQNGDNMIPFGGYELTQKAAPGVGHTYDMQGTLVATGTKEITLYKGLNLIGNSWTAPINISAMTTEDFGGAEATIVMFNTGVDIDGGGETTAVSNETADVTTSGTYVSIPVNVADAVTAYKTIPAMQAFEIRNSSGSDTQLTLDYDRIVRTSSVTINPMRAPKRAATGVEGIESTLRIYVQGERYGDYVYIFENEATTMGFDNGWDGRKYMSDNYDIPVLMVRSENINYQVSTQPRLAGTRLAFYQGEDNFYAMGFRYDGYERLWLYDNQTDSYTEIRANNVYYFGSNTEDLQQRFEIVDTNPNIPDSGPGTATGVDNVKHAADAQKLLIEEKLYIIKNGRVYDATGRLVR